MISNSATWCALFGYLDFPFPSPASFSLISQIESMDEAYRKAPLRNSPRIGVFKNDARSQYFIMCEQFTLCEVPTLKKALFYMFSAYYIFNLEYPKPAQTVFYFLQDYVLSYPDSMKRPSTYLAVMSDIKHNLC